MRDRTGKNHAKTIAAVLGHNDRDLFDLKIRAAVIDTTSNHLFWDQTSRRWVKAAALEYGTHLRTPSGGTATVLGGHAPRDTTGWMWDLTVTPSHDFYIQTATSAVLAHNCDHAVQTALRGWMARSYQIGENSQAFSLDKEAMVHILIRHVPDFWNSSATANQSFFKSGMGIDEITDTISSVVNKNREELAAIGTGGIDQVTGEVVG